MGRSFLPSTRALFPFSQGKHKGTGNLETPEPFKIEEKTKAKAKAKAKWTCCQKTLLVLSLLTVVAAVAFLIAFPTIFDTILHSFHAKQNITFHDNDTVTFYQHGGGSGTRKLRATTPQDDQVAVLTPCLWIPCWTSCISPGSNTSFPSFLPPRPRPPRQVCVRVMSQSCAPR
ncbi:hypothetical protein GWK47_023803 [Chionoecetes opilio]|uniref:Uncharacterized protein n=1 Tax=Chionoecetes opilio TaxID=41210 RepID=A0A8J5CE71_CHIOP|nr:hypothetical protein GWK47_023803 [Chionoecetes opilio]